ncbi:MAG TPA: ATP-binding protein [Phycisphaerae bacterium]|nr:ATP-binding protein [Phycisphaerae bacterium]
MILILSSISLIPVELLWAIIIILLILVGIFIAFAVRRRHVMFHLMDLLDSLRAGRKVSEYVLPRRGILGKLARSVYRLVQLSRQERDRILQESSYIQTILARLSDAVILLNTDGNIVLANQQAFEFLPQNSGDKNAALKQLFSQPPVSDQLAACRSSLQSQSQQIRLNVGSRPRIIQVTVAPVLRENLFSGTLLVLQDQTELIQSIQMKADFAANASHELRTPLASIRAAVETIQNTGLDDEQTAKRCLEIIGGHVLRLQLLVQDLLDLSRTEDTRAVVRLEPINLDDVRSVVESLFGSIAAEKHLELRFKFDPEMQAIHGDERLMMLILKNLIDNALKFTSSGFVEVRWHRQKKMHAIEESLSSVHQASDHVEEYVILEVQDTGCGIPPEDINRVFERFYTVNRSRGGADRGTGLGLAIVKHAVAAMGGIVELQSEPGKGTTIRCIWPFTQPAAIDAPSAMNPSIV